MLQDKVILVVGVGWGLGKDITVNILDHGGEVIMGDIVEDQLKEVQKEVDPDNNRT